MRLMVFGLLLVVLHTASSQEVRIVKFDEVDHLMKAESDDLKIFNFWATWCGPCIKELPYFEEANKQEGVQVYLVSLDFIQDKDKVNRFVAKKQLKSSILLLDEKDYDSYMSRVSEKWSGAIPATLFVAEDGDSRFFEKPFTRQELQDKIEQYIN